MGAMRLDRALDDREPEAGAVRLHHEERLEQACQYVGWRPGTSIRHTDGRPAVGCPHRDGDPAVALRGLDERVRSVLDQVQDHLPQLFAVGCRRNVLGRLDREANARGVEPRPEAIDRCLHEGTQIERLDPKLVASREAQQGGDLLLDALELLQNDLVFGDERRAGLERELLGQASRSGDRVTDLVRDPRGRFADRCQLLDVRERPLDGNRPLEQARRFEHQGELVGEAVRPTGLGQRSRR
jgi:hypothetical protein